MSEKIKPTYPNNHTEMLIVSVIVFFICLACYSAGRASLHKELIEVESAR